jgi:hypothetical protein
MFVSSAGCLKMEIRTVAIPDNLGLVWRDTVSSLVDCKCSHGMEKVTVFNSSFWNMIYYSTFHRKKILLVLNITPFLSIMHSLTTFVNIFRLKYY